MKMKRDFKKYIKVAGNILTVIAFIFIVVKVVSLDVDFSQLITDNSLYAFLISSILQIVNIILCGTVWCLLIKIISNKRLDTRKGVGIYTKSNVMKYIPGNVFQYVGRNEFAITSNIPYGNVISATIIDILFTLIASAIVSLILLGKSFFEYLQPYILTVVLIIATVIVVAVIAFLLLYSKFKDKIKTTISNYKFIVEKANILKFLGCFFAYVVFQLISILSFFIILTNIFAVDVNTANIGLICGAYMFSWIIGYITPGAPGGIGVREAVMILICNSIVADDIVVLSLICMRITSTAADVLAWLLGFIISKTSKK